MNPYILKLAKECGDWNGQTIEMNDVGIEAFYRAAFNAGIEAAAKLVDEKFDCCEPWLEPHEVRALEKKP